MNWIRGRSQVSKGKMSIYEVFETENVAWMGNSEQLRFKGKLALKIRGSGHISDSRSICNLVSCVFLSKGISFNIYVDSLTVSSLPMAL